MQPRILLVDDREDNLISIEAILALEDYRFVKANSGREALKALLKEDDFALILMDVQMPNLNGFETAALIYERQKLRHIPIIFITAHNYGDENVYKGYRAGAVDYVYKPINPELLRMKVGVFTELYRKNWQLIMQEQKLITINKNLENEIHERKVSEEKVTGLNLELLKKIDELEAANKDLDRFAFMASHDLQEPLRKIRMFSDRLLSRYKETLDDDGLMFIDRIQNAAGRMQMLIKDILTFSKITVDEKSFVESEINPIIDEVLFELREEIAKKEAVITVEKIPSLVVNPVLMQPLFHNLISNALKYSKKDAIPEIKIYARTERSSDNNSYCRIHIEDNGIGFDQKYAEQIFGMFRRLHNNNEYEGTGIGLTLCKKIVEQHHGFISAKSRTNDGSVFIISLPLTNISKPKVEELDAI